MPETKRRACAEDGRGRAGEIHIAQHHRDHLAARLLLGFRSRKSEQRIEISAEIAEVCAHRELLRLFERIEDKAQFREGFGREWRRACLHRGHRDGALERHRGGHLLRINSVRRVELDWLGGRGLNHTQWDCTLSTHNTLRGRRRHDAHSWNLRLCERHTGNQRHVRSDKRVQT